MLKEARLDCSSGMEVTVRNFTAGDFHELTAAAGSSRPTAEVMAQLAGRVVTQVHDRGPYSFASKTPDFRGGVLVGDRTEVLLQARVLTSGPVKEIRVQCEGCGGWFPMLHDYSTMPSRKWPAVGEGKDHECAARDHFTANEPCVHTIKDGPEVQFNLLTGRLLEGRIQTYTQQYGDTLQAEIAARIVDVEEEDFSSIRSKGKRMEAQFNWVTALDENEFWDLWMGVQDQEVGPETDRNVRCPFPSCSLEFAYTVGTVDFIWPAVPKRSLRSRAGR